MSLYYSGKWGLPVEITSEYVSEYIQGMERDATYEGAVRDKLNIILAYIFGPEVAFMNIAILCILHGAIYAAILNGFCWESYKWLTYDADWFLSTCQSAVIHKHSRFFRLSDL